MESATKVMIESVIEQMIRTGEKINVSSVAKRAGVSNSLIYNRYPELKVKIEGVKNKQSAKQNTIKSTTDVESLKKKLATAKKKQDEAIEVAHSYQKQNDELWEHIQQVYSMYDQILAERNSFAERLKYLS